MTEPRFESNAHVLDMVYARLQEMGTAYHALQDRFSEEHRIALELEAKLQYFTERCKNLELVLEEAETKGYLNQLGL